MSHIRFTNTVFSIGGTPTEVLSYNPRRKYLMIQNQSLGNIFISFDNKATVFDAVIIGPAPNGFYELDTAIPASSISIYSPTIAKVIVVEGI